MSKAASALIALAILAIVSISCGSNGPPGPHWRVVLEPQAEIAAEDSNAVLDQILDVAERRIVEFGGELLASSRSDTGITIEFIGLLLEDARTLLEQTGLLQFCEPVMDDRGNVAVLRTGNVRHKAGTCEPARDDAGVIIVEPRFDRVGNALPDAEVEFVPWARQAINPPDDVIVWQLATSTVGGDVLALDNTLLLPTTFVTMMGQVMAQPVLIFKFDGPGEEILEQITARLSERAYPLAVFMDGAPLLDSNGIMIAPQVQAPLTDGRGTISGLTSEAAEELSMLLHSGAYPVPVQVTDVSAVLD